MAGSLGQDKGERTGRADPDTKPATAPAPLRPNSPRALREREEDRIRQRQNIIAGVAIVGLLFAVYWLMNAMSDARKLEMCLEARHRNCGPVDVAPPAP